jgi:NDP-sugar pyrophosphorylase family protein
MDRVVIDRVAKDRGAKDRVAKDRLAKDRSVSLEREVLPAQLTRGLLAFKSDGYFIDIGVPQDLARAQSELGAVVGL